MLSGMREDVRAVFDRDPPLGIGSRLLLQALGFMQSGFTDWRTLCGVGD